MMGLGLATFSLTRSHADEGGATLVHSGAVVGLGLGAMTDYLVEGSAKHAPYTGSGYGAAAGLLLGGVASKFLKVPASRVLLIDLGAGLGAAAGAAAASPLVFDNDSPERTRGFLAATAGGTILGGLTAWWLTRTESKTATASRGQSILPWAGTLPRESVVRGDDAVGAGIRSHW